LLGQKLHDFQVSFPQFADGMLFIPFLYFLIAFLVLFSNSIKKIIMSIFNL